MSLKRQRGIFGIPVMFLIYGAAVVAVIAGAWWGVHSIEKGGYERGMAECARKAQEQRDKETKQGAGASTQLETGNAKAKVVYRTITQSVDRYIDRPVYRNVCLDADGVRDANAALRSAGAPAGQPDKPVPGSDGVAGRDRGLGAAEADRSGGALLRVPAEAGGAR